jgi:hypothetical protein
MLPGDAPAGNQTEFELSIVPGARTPAPIPIAAPACSGLARVSFRVWISLYREVGPSCEINTLGAPTLRDCYATAQAFAA